MSSLHEHAVHYASMGWAVIPIQPKLKVPATSHGVKDATLDRQQIDTWWTTSPSANVAVAAGEPSGIVVLDVDPRNGGDETLESMLVKNGALPDTVTAISGGGGMHYLFQWEPGVASAKLGPGLELLSTGKYFIVAPSRHPKGGTYTWEASSGPGMAPIANLPAWLRLSSSGDKPGASGAASDCLDAKLEADLQAALAAIEVQNGTGMEYDDWFKVLCAIHDAAPNERGFAIADAWSKQSSKYDMATTLRTWNAIKPGRGISYQSLFTIAAQHGWENKPAAVAVEDEPFEPWTEPATAHMPEDLLRVPGKLQEVVDYINAGAWISQPGFAVMAALGVGSACASRIYISENGVPVNLWLLTVGEPSCGKQWPRDAIKALMNAAGYGAMLNQGGYTSKEALFTVLKRTPAHLTMLDEAGMWLESAKGDSKGFQAGLISKLMEAFGSEESSIRPEERANNSRHQVEIRDICKPGVSMYLSTTPSTLYRALSDKDIHSGFVPRLLILESHIKEDPRGYRRRDKSERAPPPASLVEWMKSIRTHIGNLSPDDNGGWLDTVLREIPISDAAIDAFRALTDVCSKTRNQLPRGALYGRCVYQAERVANVLAAFDNPQAPVITGEIAEWACKFVLHLMDALNDACEDKLSETQLGEILNKTIALIRNKGREGATERDLFRGPWKGRSMQDRASLMEALRNGEYAKLLPRGRTKAWYAQGAQPLSIYEFASKMPA